MSSLSPQLDPLAERMKRLLCTGVNADVHFLVGEEDDGQELLPAHKLILRIASDVFDAMFRFDEAKQNEKNASTEVSNNDQVLIPDVDIEAFKTMLDFIYTDNLKGVNGKNVFDVLYAANKYNLPMLVKACGDIPISELDNVFFALVKARLLDEKDFAGHCLAYIDGNADTLIKSDEFLQIDQKLLCELLGRDQLIVTEEIAIWNAALRWADEQCRQNDLDFSSENRRQMLGPALYQIRFPIIHEEFLKDIVSSGLLTSAQLVGVLLYRSTPNASNGGAVSVPYPLLFPIRQRSVKSTGKLTFKIEKFSTFGWDKTYSESVHIGGFQWNILAQIKTKSDIKYLGFFLYCNAKNHASDWSCSCSASLRIVSQKQGQPDDIVPFCQDFKAKSLCWGRLSRTLTEVMDPNNGWYMEEEDTVILSADVTVKE